MILPIYLPSISISKASVTPRDPLHLPLRQDLVRSEARFAALEPSVLQLREELEEMRKLRLGSDVDMDSMDQISQDEGVQGFQG